jgi:polysaccharide biosynthesis/export protein ExoF
MTTANAVASSVIAGLLGFVAPSSVGDGNLDAPNLTAQQPARAAPAPIDLDQAAQPQPTPKEQSADAAGDENCGAGQIDDEGAKRLTIGRGDKIKLSFYEVLKSIDRKWGAEHEHYQEPLKMFQQHAELSNEYVVQDDGSIVIPQLGRFVVEGESSLKMKHQLECAFVADLGRSGFVTVSSITKPPVFVVGEVRNPGSYEFAPGTTVLQVIALAGGFERTPIDPSVVAQLVGETARLRSAVDRAVRMMARSSAIEAARTTGVMPNPGELAAIVGRDKAQMMMGEEFTVQNTDKHALIADEASLKGAVDSAQADLELREAASPLLQEAIALRRDRVKYLTKLASDGSISRPVLLQAQTELLDAESRGQEAQNVTNQAQQQLNRARRDLEARKEQAATKTLREEAEARQAAGEAAQETDAAADLIKVMAKVQFRALEAPDVKFKIIRRTRDGAAEFPAKDTTLLEPGDLVVTLRAADQEAGR